MNFVNSFKQQKFLLLFLFFVLVYFFLYGPVGYDDADTSYTMALSWRIFNGEIPYRDFILVRPPFSPFVHALPLYFIPDNYQIIFDRFLFYGMIAASCLFATFTIGKVFQLEKINIEPYLLATVGFIFSVHNFSATGWHAVDGVFFGALGIFVLTKFSSLPVITIGILFLFLSALCKQPFYLIPCAGIVYVHLLHKSWSKTIIATVTLLVCGGIFFGIFYKLHILKSFIVLTTGSTTLKDLILAGFIHYVHFSASYLILPFLLWIAARKFQNNRYLQYKFEVIPYFFITLLFIIPISRFFILLFIGQDLNSFYYDDIVGNLLLDITIIFLLLNIKLEKKWITLLFLTCLSWCSSISWSYQNPAFFSVPLIFGFLLLANRYFNINNINNMLIYMLFLGALTYFGSFQKPYQNPIRKNITYSVADLFPKLNNIKVSKEIYEKYHEFYTLINKYGNNFKTLPGMPLSNYLTNSKSPIIIDWVFDAETGLYNSEIINTLQKKNTIIFMDRKPGPISISDTTEKYNSSVSYFIKTHWKKIDSTNYFEIYKFKL